ncbi:hypothetical protein C8C83_2057 [Flavobacterium sp. 90]|uniref:hypothetical protein n=1 Tax=unclassified Flavobacterium TaxID=196869 RepID=UPI000EAEBFEA|nr:MULTISPECIES: hypothetical protein [unclassified Flavobacterium]RKR10382.1 hypothetical protein C8C82_2360 [Flavobacterium sp. 81]TCK54167.1 hypothetical protein C8C83_2057 [Flavobacterium sp. 90]
MKTVLIAIISLLSFSMQSQNRYELQDRGEDKLYLSNYITTMSERKIIKSEPIIVIDGIAFHFQNLEKQKLPLYKNEIQEITPLDREKGINIYGNFAENGVLIVTTNRKKSSNKHE